jgi:hypothetical protein
VRDCNPLYDASAAAFSFASLESFQVDWT